MILFVPLALTLMRLMRYGDETPLQYSTAATSVAVFLGVPLAAAIVTRFGIRKRLDADFYHGKFLKYLSPWSLVGLLFTILVLFASRGKQAVQSTVSVARISAPLIVYLAILFFTALWLAHILRFGYKLAAVQNCTAVSNNFELAILVAVATFGPDSDQALAAAVGPLIEVPVLLSLVYVVKWFVGRRSLKE